MSDFLQNADVKLSTSLTKFHSAITDFYQLEPLPKPEIEAKTLPKGQISDTTETGALSVQPVDYDADTEADASRVPSRIEASKRRSTYRRKSRLAILLPQNIYLFMWGIIAASIASYPLK